MRPLAIAFLFSFISFTASSQTKENQAAVAFNNKMIDMLKGLNDNGKTWVETYTTIRDNTKNFAELEPERKKLQNYIDTNLNILNAMQDVAGSESYRAAVIHFFEVEKKLVAETFAPFEKLNKKSSKEETDKLWNRLSGEATKQEADCFSKIKDLQKEYAERNDFVYQ